MFCCTFAVQNDYYQCNICSSHSYNPNLTSGPAGPHQIGNYFPYFANEHRKLILLVVEFVLQDSIDTFTRIGREDIWRVS